MGRPETKTLIPEDVLSARDALLAAGEQLKDCIRELHVADAECEDAVTDDAASLLAAIWRERDVVAREAQRATIAAALVAYADAVRGWRF